MEAGRSARVEAARSLALAEKLRHEARELTARGRHFAAGADGEVHVATALAELAPYGYRALHDRRWPGTSRSNLDHVVVGPSGVYVIDTKSWHGELYLDATCLRCGDEDRTDEVRQVIAATAAVAEVAAEAGLPALMCTPVLVLLGHPVLEGVAAAVVCGARELVGHVLRAGRQLDDEQVEAVHAALDAGLRPAVEPPPVRPVVEPATQLGLLTADEVTEAALEGQRRRPIDEWMTFLHPSHARVVVRSFDGPALIRGGTGTGKTVVALHRAARLARDGFTPILFTTHVKVLAKTFEELFTRLAPAATGEVEFTNIHAWALRLLRERGHRPRLDGAAADDAYDAAWAARTAGTRPPRVGDKEYWRAEISAVIKGQGLTTPDEYLQVARAGRGRGLQRAQREWGWELFATYEDELRRREVVDFDDVVSSALRSVLVEPLAEPYRCVIVDEAQDCTVEGLRLLSNLTTGGRDGLLLVGDGQQAIYPAAARLSDVPLETQRRVVTLTTNYRTSQAILDKALELLADPGFVDLDGSTAARGEMVALRAGEPPLLRTFRTRDTERAELVARLRETLALPDVSPRDVGVLVPYTGMVGEVVALLAGAGVHAHGLRDEVHPAGVRVGTWASSKGLEFKHVFMPSCRDCDETESPTEERWRRARFVAMTRARDTLWMGRVRPAATP